MIVGLTGGIGSGKTTVARLFSQTYGVDVICADAIAKEVIAFPEVVSKLKTTFGNEVIQQGFVSRKALREIIIQETKAQQQLNEIMHPAIRQRLSQKAHQSQSIYTLVDIPLLDQNTLAFYPYLSKIITVVAPIALRIKRVMLRDHQTEAQVIALIEKQVSDKERVSFSDYVIENKTMDKLPKQVEFIHIDLLRNLNNVSSD